MRLKLTLRSIFLRSYAISLKRPWLKENADAAFDDARYRLSVPFAAPIVTLTAILVVLVRRQWPAILNRHIAALVICGMLVAAGVGVYLTLGRLFKDYSINPDAALQYDKPLSGFEVATWVFMWACIAGYCLMMTCI